MVKSYESIVKNDKGKNTQFRLVITEFAPTATAKRLVRNSTLYITRIHKQTVPIQSLEYQILIHRYSLQPCREITHCGRHKCDYHFHNLRTGCRQQIKRTLLSSEKFLTRLHHLEACFSTRLQLSRQTIKKNHSDQNF